ncbi:PorT family protein [Mucilaginibacter flavidus]|uniref:PorT family protein n=1 Tax=Mucilaginibacter flavidus TaxID=2949309 RepID=UPI002092109E|nr:PorT family protein [Mucilaginibacter flavidus]MCO5949587.1 PorT family protein [Mucilaginibacter flavidus]
MNTENEKRLDDLFKKKLEDPVDEIRYEEGDWDALEQLLDKPKRKGIIYLWPILSGVAALMLVFLGWWALRPKNGGQQSGNPTQIAAHPKKDTIIDNKSIAGTKRPDTIIDKPAIAQQAVKDTAIDKSQTIAGKKTNSIAKDKVQSIAGKKVLKNNLQKQPATLAVKNDKQQFATTPVSPKKDTIIDKAVKNNNVSNDAYAINQAPVTKSATTDNKPAVIQPAVTQPAVDTKNGLATNTPVKPKVKPQMAYRPQYTLSVIAAPDLNGVNSFAQSKVGTNIGLTFAVGLSRKLTVTTGALYSVKPYATNFNNYRNGVKWPVSPQEVTADCRMLDIPLNVSYQVYHRNQNKLSFGTGLSSYIMLHESYKFEYNASSITSSYSGGSNATGPSTINVANPGKYFFGVVNLNATYEHQINSKVGISIQPYMKIPLSNIGYSQVKLQSTGVAVGLSWNLNSLTKP